MRRERHSLSGMPLHLCGLDISPKAIRKSDTNGFRTLVDRADDPQACPGAGAALVLPQPVPGVTWPVSLRRLPEGVMRWSAAKPA
jgi:hypothetical protein